MAPVGITSHGGERIISRALIPGVSICATIPGGDGRLDLITMPAGLIGAGAIIPGIGGQADGGARRCIAPAIVGLRTEAMATTATVTIISM